jgi:riboflavin synthase
MFTGLIDDIGAVREVADTAAGRTLHIACRYTDLTIGESIACNGACLTVLDRGPAWFSVAAVQTTLERTTIGTWVVGTRLNLERALPADGRLGGHFVQGHVDGAGTVRDARMQGDAWLLDIAVPADIDELLVPHGSVAVDGVSLTVNAQPAPGVLQVSIIDHTRRHTTLGDRRAGDRVHLEGDLLGKYVRKLLQRGSVH